MSECLKIGNKFWIINSFGSILKIKFRNLTENGGGVIYGECKKKKKTKMDKALLKTWDKLAVIRMCNVLL